MIRTIAAGLALTVAGMSMTACGASEEPDYVGVCVNPDTQVRLEDDACDKGDDDFLTYAVLWYMLSNSSRSYPAVGSHVNPNYFRTRPLPSGKTYKTGLSKTGGSSVKSYTTKKYGGSTFGGSSSSKSGSSSKSWGSSGGSKSYSRR